MTTVPASSRLDSRFLTEEALSSASSRNAWGHSFLFNWTAEQTVSFAVGADADGVVRSIATFD